MFKRPNEQSGMILPATIILVGALMFIGFALLSGVTSQYSLANDDVFTDNALQVAEAGIEQSMDQLNQNNNFSGYSTPQTLFDNSTQGNGTFTVTVANATDNSNAKVITSTGDVYYYGKSTDPVSTKTVQVTVVGTQSQGYSVLGGPGGLILGGSAAITNSEVYVNGTISLSGASSIGTQNQPLTVDAANYACPSGGGSNWPEVCSSTQPISFSGSSKIYGTVCATGQTSSTDISGGSGGAGLEAGCTAPQVSTPTYNRSAQIADVTTTSSGSNATYDCTDYENGVGFTRTWPANLELTGNVDLASSCNLTVTGDVYITGNLTIGGAATITVANSAGTTPPVIIVDGTVTVGGSASVVTNSSKTGLEFISFDNSTGNPGATVTGSSLYTSQSQTTVSLSGASNLAGCIFDAYWGEIQVSGSGNVGAAIGQTVNMSGAGTVTFGTEVGSGTETWTISSYQVLPNNTS